MSAGQLISAVALTILLAALAAVVAGLVRGRRRRQAQLPPLSRACLKRYATESLNPSQSNEVAERERSPRNGPCHVLTAPERGPSAAGVAADGEISFVTRRLDRA